MKCLAAVGVGESDRCLHNVHATLVARSVVALTDCGSNVLRMPAGVCRIVPFFFFPLWIVTPTFSAKLSKGTLRRITTRKNGCSGILVSVDEDGN